MSAAATDWQKYHKWNSRDRRMAAFWVRDLVKYLTAEPWFGPQTAALDFGCGYFDAGAALAVKAGRVDGVDIEADAVAVARGRAAGLPASDIYDAADAVPRGRYDVVFANSVFQYLGGDEGVADALRLCRELLRPGGAGKVVLADLIPRRYWPAGDALRSLWVAGRHGFLLPMAVYLGRAALGGTKALHRIDPERIAELAAAAGFDCERLPANLTPSRRRYTCVLTARGA